MFQQEKSRNFLNGLYHDTKYTPSFSRKFQENGGKHQLFGWPFTKGIASDNVYFENL
jgi:hypothetical protein